MLLQVILEGLGLGVLLVLICAVGIRKGAVGMVLSAARRFFILNKIIYFFS